MGMVTPYLCSTTGLCFSFIFLSLWFRSSTQYVLNDRDIDWECLNQHIINLASA